MEAMPEFEIVSVKEATLRTTTPRQGHYLQEHASYIQQIPQGQAGKLHLVENENPATIRKRLVLAAQALDITLAIKRSGQDIYFWIEPPIAAEKPQSRRGRRSRTQQESTPPEEPQSIPEEARLPEE
jgi:hypothetical protein